MKRYDFKKAKRFIESNKSEIISASLGMAEDWFWTAETVFENGNFVVDLDYKCLEIMGLDGSAWATPVLSVEYKNGDYKIYKCFKGESDGVSPPWFGLGILSSECQNARSDKQIEEMPKQKKNAKRR